VFEIAQTLAGPRAHPVGGFNLRLTVPACHSPLPARVCMPRSFSPAAMAHGLRAPAACSSAMMGPWSHLLSGRAHRGPPDVILAGMLEPRPKGMSMSGVIVGATVFALGLLAGAAIAMWIVPPS
jgi:hypothetical protein